MLHKIYNRNQSKIKYLKVIAHNLNRKSKYNKQESLELLARKSRYKDNLLFLFDRSQSRKDR